MFFSFSLCKKGLWLVKLRKKLNQVILLEEFDGVGHEVKKIWGYFCVNYL
jgi:hypothetical protein